MSLVTIQRSPTPTNASEDSSDHLSDISSVNNLNEDFFASTATVILQNQVGRRRSSVIREEDTLQCHLIKIVDLLRKEDSLKLMVNLEKVNWKIDGYRYFCVISRNGKQDTDEYLILGVNVSIGRATIGFVLPIHQDMLVELDGDGGFKIQNKDGEKLFKPTSVHALWTTVQLLNKACSIAHQNNYYHGGLNHTWINYYNGIIKSTRGQIAEWNRMLDADTVVNSNLAPQSAIGEYVMGTEMDARRQQQETIRLFLEEIMRDEDMDNVTIVSLREKLQAKVSFELKDLRSFIAEEILRIYGKMDEASRILPYLYLGSTYNASNLQELLRNKISHILNVTRESENFFREKFIYKNVEVFDEEETKLLKHFDPCYKFINDAKIQNGACLVHCQRGISRSASIVISYMMKESNWTLEEAFDYVKKYRDCIKPNDGFMQQLKTYEGILQASAHRHNLKFRNERRDNIKSFPNYVYENQEKDSIAETSSLSGDLKYSYGNVFRSQSIKTEVSDTVAFPEEENADNDDDVLDINDDLLMYKDLYTNSSNVLDFLYDGPPGQTDNVVEGVEINEARERRSNHLSEHENSEDNFKTDFNANISPENISSVYPFVEKKPLKIKSDYSWIKSSGNCNEGEDLYEQSAIGSKSFISSSDQILDIHDECHTLPEICQQSDDPLKTVEIDQQSLRPVKELLGVYKKE